MVTALVVGVVVGFTLSLPPGPISVAVMRHAIAGEFGHGLRIGLGAASMDTLYSLAAVFASSALVVAVKDAIVTNEWILLVAQVLAVGVMVTLGVRYMRPTQEDVQRSADREANTERKAERIGGGRPYAVGVFMSIVNLPSPTFLPSLIAVATFLHANELVDSSAGQCILYSIGFGTGAGLWFTTLLKSLYSVRHRISATFIGRIYKFTGASFFLFAIILLYNVVRSTSWAFLRP